MSGCTNCLAEKACQFIGVVDAALAVACDYDHYCPSATQYPADNACSAGKFLDNDASSDCVDCVHGYT